MSSYLSSKYVSSSALNNCVKTNSSTTITSAQVSLGTNTSSNTKKRYYINDVGNGSFAKVWADTVEIYGGTIKNTTVSSSARYKDNIIYQDNDYWHDNLMKIETCTYNYNNDDTLHFGIIAEDLYKIFPNLVKLDEEGNCDSIHMFDLIPLLISETQKLNNRITDLETKINSLLEG